MLKDFDIISKKIQKFECWDSIAIQRHLVSRNYNFQLKLVKKLVIFVQIWTFLDQSFYCETFSLSLARFVSQIWVSSRTRPCETLPHYDSYNAKLISRNFCQNLWEWNSVIFHTVVLIWEFANIITYLLATKKWNPSETGAQSLTSYAGLESGDIVQ